MGATILQDLVVVMVVAAATTILFYRLKQPVVLGYLLAGLIIGPYTPFVKLISDESSISALAELGLIFLMFAVGLEFNLRKLREVGATAFIGATVEIALMIALGYWFGMTMGWGPMNSIFLGAILSISSTTIIVKVLMERGEMHEGFADVAFGILIVEDLLAIVMVAILSGFGTGSLDASLVGSALLRVGLFVFIVTAVGLVLVPRLIDWVSRFHVEEVLIITVVGLAVGGAILAAKLGFSLALGAFLLGAIIAESHAVRRVEHKIVPIRDLFTAVFFVAVGMLIDPAVLKEHALAIALITLLTIAGKVVACTAGTFLAGRDGKTSLKVGMAMAQIGEFSFIIAGMGLALGITDSFLYPVAVAVCALTTLASPYLIKSSDRIVNATSSRMPDWIAGLGRVYTRFFQRASASAHVSSPPRAARHGARMLVYAAWLLGLFIAGGFLSLWFEAAVGDAYGLGSELKRTAGVVVVGALGAPLFVSFVKATEAWAHELAKARAFNPNRLARADPRFRRSRLVARTVAFTAAVALILLSGSVAWGVHPFALPSWFFLAPALLAVGLVGYVLWRRSERLYDWMEETLDTLLDDEPEVKEPIARLRERYPWGVDVEEVPILASSWGAYTSLRDLALRERTGATVMSVERGVSVMPNPHPDMGLLPGDRVILVGTRDQIDRAARLLHERGAPPRPGTVREPGPAVRGPAATPVHRARTEEMRIPPSSPVVGQTFAELGLRDRTGASVATLWRRDGEQVHPSPGVRIQPGDRVLVAGTDDSLRAARELMRVRDEFGIGRVGGGRL